MKIYWWLIVFPSLALGITLYALNFLGDGLRDALDPKLATTYVAARAVAAAKYAVRLGSPDLLRQLDCVRQIQSHCDHHFVLVARIRHEQAAQKSIAVGSAVWKNTTPGRPQLIRANAVQGTSRMRPRAYRRTPSEQISYVTGSRNCHNASASAADCHESDQPAAAKPRDQCSDAQNAGRQQPRPTPIIGQRPASPADRRRRRRLRLELLRQAANGRSHTTSFDQRLLSMPVTNHAMIQYSIELNRSAPTISTPK